MNGIWTSLTVQGKLVIAAAGVSVLAILGVLYEGRGGSNAAPGLGLLPTQQPSPTLTGPSGLDLVTATPSPVGAEASPTEAQPAIDSPTATPAAAATATPDSGTGPVPTATSAAPTATSAPIPTQPPTPPTSTTVPTFTPGCSVGVISVSAEVGLDPQVTARFICDGQGVTNSAMSAFFNYQSTVSTCDAVSDGFGTASCLASNPGVEAGAVSSVTVCFDSGGQLFCNTQS